MMNYVGLDVSQKTTTLCIVDGEGHRQWRGECVTSPEQIVRAVLQHAGAGARIGIELSWSTAAGIRAATVCDIKRSSSLGQPAA